MKTENKREDSGSLKRNGAGSLAASGTGAPAYGSGALGGTAAGQDSNKALLDQARELKLIVKLVGMADIRQAKYARIISSYVEEKDLMKTKMGLSFKGRLIRYSEDPHGAEPCLICKGKDTVDGVFCERCKGVISPTSAIAALKTPSHHDRLTELGPANTDVEPDGHISSDHLIPAVIEKLSASPVKRAVAVILIVAFIGGAAGMAFRFAKRNGAFSVGDVFAGKETTNAGSLNLKENAEGAAPNKEGSLEAGAPPGEGEPPLDEGQRGGTLDTEAGLFEGTEASLEGEGPGIDTRELYTVFSKDKESVKEAFGDITQTTYNHRGTDIDVLNTDDGIFIGFDPNTGEAFYAELELGKTPNAAIMGIKKGDREAFVTETMEQAGAVRDKKAEEYWNEKLKQDGREGMSILSYKYRDPETEKTISIIITLYMEGVTTVSAEASRGA